jgi:hypothetical protein
MKKLTLHLEALSVESFDTTDGGEAEGTVVGAQDTAYGPSCADTCATCEGATCIASCEVTCNGTCGYTCSMSCYGTCRNYRTECMAEF